MCKYIEKQLLFLISVSEAGRYKNFENISRIVPIRTITIEEMEYHFPTQDDYYFVCSHAKSCMIVHWNVDH